MVDYNVDRVTQKNTGSCGRRDGGPKARRLSWNRFLGDMVPESSSEQASQGRRETVLVMETESGSCMDCSEIKRSLG